MCCSFSVATSTESGVRQQRWRPPKPPRERPPPASWPKSNGPPPPPPRLRSGLPARRNGTNAMRPVRPSDSNATRTALAKKRQH